VPRRFSAANEIALQSHKDTGTGITCRPFESPRRITGHLKHQTDLSAYLAIRT
jgi:hypothetical protein